MGPRKELRYTTTFPLKVPTNEPPPGLPAGPLWREILVYRAFKVPSI